MMMYTPIGRRSDEREIPLKFDASNEARTDEREFPQKFIASNDEREFPQRFNASNSAVKRKLFVDGDKTNLRSGGIVTKLPPRRILGRRYPLTKTGYKHLDIGINASTQSQVEIAIGDTHNREIVLTPDLWKSMLNHRDAIVAFFATNTDSRLTPSPIYIEHFTFRFGKINNLGILRIETPTMRLAMSKDTVCNMLVLEYCVDRITQELQRLTAAVDAKLKRFVEISAGAKDPISAFTAIRDSDSFNKNDLIDCELLAQIFAMS